MIDETDAAGVPAAPGDAGKTRPSATKTGFGASVAAFAGKHRLALSIAGGVLAVALLGTGAFFAGATVNPGDASQVAATTTPTPTADPARPAPAAAPAASRIRTCSVADRAADARLANFQAQVVNAATGEMLYDRGGTTPSRTASVMKVLTSAAALSVLGPDHRAATTVVKGAEPGSVVLVGGGDATLSRTSRRAETVYPGAAHLDELAAQVRAAWTRPLEPAAHQARAGREPVQRGRVGAELDLVEREFGYMSNITALMVDGDRDDPGAETSWRSADPIGRAGDAFASELGGISVIERGTAPAGAQQLGQVFSSTVAQLVDKALVVSDNTVAEMLARLVAIETGAGNTFGAINQAVSKGSPRTASTRPASPWSTDRG